MCIAPERLTSVAPLTLPTKSAALDDGMNLAATPPWSSDGLSPSPDEPGFRADEITGVAASLLAAGKRAEVAGEIRDATLNYIEACRLFDALGDVQGIVECIESIAALQAVAQPEWAMKLWGASATLREEHVGGPLAGHDQHDDGMVMAREHLRFSVLARALADGASLSRRQAVAMACGDNTPERWDRLTPAERVVARLVGDGLTNAEVARRLGISARTVQAHLTHTFRKLRLSSRTGLAREVSQRVGTSRQGMRRDGR